MDEESKYPRKYSISMTQEDFDAMVGIADKRQDSTLAGVFREAVDQYIEGIEGFVPLQQDLVIHAI